MSEQPPNDRDDELRQLISGDARTSRKHDEAVLAAARSHARRKGPSPLRRAISFALAASLALFAIFMLQRPSEEDTLRSSAQGLEKLVTPVSGTTVSSPPAEFRWPLQPGATAYRVTLRDASANVIWNSGPISQARAGLSTQSPLTPQTYYWTVEVEGETGSQSLGPFWFRLQ